MRKKVLILRIASRILAIILSVLMLGCSGIYTGTVAVKGNEPHTYLVLVTGQGLLKITGPLAKKIRQDFQGKKITVKGAIVSKGLGPGFPPEVQVCEVVGAY